jgi:micrococcal nuclease
MASILIFVLGLVSASNLNKDGGGEVAGSKDEIEGPYKVKKVVDGDTIDVTINDKTVKVRLIGINTPETVDPRKEVECFGKEASNKAKELLDKNEVYLEKDESQANKDKYDRLLRYIYLEDNTNVNLEMIKEGYAFEYTYETPYKYQELFKKAETEAKDNNRGLWNSSSCQYK